MPKLYELTTDYQAVWQLVEDDTTDLAVIEDTLQALEGDIEVKAASIATFIRGLTYDIDAIKAEEKRLADRRKAMENRVTAIKTYVQSQMEAAGLSKIKTSTQTISLQNNPPAVYIADERLIPAKYLTVIPQTTVADKKRIAEALKAGENVPGCELTQGKSLRIR